MQMHDILRAHQVERQVERRQSRKRERHQSIGCRSRLPASQAYMFCVQASTGVAEARIQSTGNFCCRFTYHSVCNRSRRCQFPPTSHWLRRPSNGCKAHVKWGQLKLETRCGGAHDSPAFSKARQARVATYRERLSAGARHAAESQTVAMVSARLVRRHGKRNARIEEKEKK